MNLLEIVMLIIGIFTIILSCRIVASPDKNQNDLSLYTHEGLDIFKEQQSEILSSVSEEAITKTDDYLSKLSNEKIMAVSEYSDQILEKITRNHEEVVFLYNMLDHKEKELKKTGNIFNNSNLKAKELNNSEEKEPEKETVNSQLKTKKLGKIVDMNFVTDDMDQATISINNTEILKLHKQGESVLDIAKQLGIGQGEVKLVIDLFIDR